MKAFVAMGICAHADRARAQAGGVEVGAPPRENDLMVFAFGDRAGEAIMPRDLGLGQQQVFAYPKEPVTGTIRNGTRLNQILLVRLEPVELSRESEARSAGGVVAYSAVCTHTGCDITDWDAQTSRFQCPCHESQFDPADSARVVGGPAPWRLAPLPLKLIDGVLAAAGEFEGPVGFQQPGASPFGF